MARRILAAGFLILLAAALVACRGLLFPYASGRTPSADDLVNTAAAKTVSVLGTQLAAGGNVTLAPPSIPTNTPAPTQTPKPKPTVTGTADPNCNRAAFVRDVTIPDGSTILPNSIFTKTWELKNIGDCPWDASYSVVFSGKGTAMSGPAAQQMISSGIVKPGQTALVSVSLRAPNEPGDYEGDWVLRTGGNYLFGIGQSGTAPFFVKIHVAEEYSFAEHVCSAEWSSGAGKLPCPGKDGDSHGFILPLNNPTMEDNQTREGLGFFSMPQPVNGGYIVGKYPPMLIPEHMDFRTTLSCAPDANGCFVHFKITYKVDNGAEQVLGEWNEGYEGGVTEVVKDLNMVGGRSTAFYFYVYVSGPPDQSKALWFFPRIIKN